MYLRNKLLFRDGDGPRGACYEEPPIEDFLPIWTWVKYAKYNNTEEYDNHKIDIYVYKVGQECKRNIIYYVTNRKTALK